MISLHNWWNGVNKVKASLSKDPQPLRFGVLSAASINFTALFDPIATHTGAVVSAIAARDIQRAAAQIEKYGLSNATAYGSYDELLANPDIDAVYIPLPTSFHYEWTLKTLEAGKHVLVEKPIALNAREAHRICECAARRGKIVLEAFHWPFHPAAQAVKELIDSGVYGAVRSINARMALPAGAMPEDEIRSRYPLGGGACMDMAYVFSAACYYADARKDTTVEILRAEPRTCRSEPRTDEAMSSTFTLRDSARAPVTCTVETDLAVAKLFGIIPRFWAITQSLSIELENARIQFNNFATPWLQHTVTTEERNASAEWTGKKEVRKWYKGGSEWGNRGEDWWTTYRHQLEAFCAKVKEVEAGEGTSGEGSRPWLMPEDSAKVMSVIDAVYQKSELPRPGDD